MQLVIKLQDNEGVEHKRATIELDDQATIKALQKRLERIFNIEPDLQQIFFGNSQIDELSVQLGHIITGNEFEFVLKHSALDNWARFKAISTKIEKILSYKAKPFIQDAVKQLVHLNKSDFFVAYPRFGETSDSFNEKYAHILDKNEEHIKIAAKVFFLDLFGCNRNNPNVAVDFEKKQVRGVQGGFICVVTKTKIDKTKAEPCEEMVKKYHVKIYSGVSSRRSGDGNVDVREIFVYKLLEKIKIGPKVYFIPNIHKSRFGMYIATEDVYGFEMKSKKSLNAEQMSKLNFLEYILMLADLRRNEDNFGCDDKGNLIIVDFQVGIYMSGYAIKDFKDEKYANYLTSWEFPTIFDDINKEIEEQKEFLEKKNISRNASKELEMYIEQIKKKCDEILTNPPKKFKQST